MPLAEKPAEGSWTEHYPELGTALISYEDSISPEHYELEREAIFKKTWLNVGRVEQLPKNGSYFTREIDAAGYSVIIVRGNDGEVRAFQNVCRHRGNKLVWDDYPKEETSGFCRTFVCKYHAWRFGLDGKVEFIQQEDEFFDIDKSTMGLVPVRADIWQGFVFVNFDDEAGPLEDYLGRFATNFDGYPFSELKQAYKYRTVVNANWKLYIDAFAEFYHAPFLHSKQYVGEESRKLLGYGYQGLHYELDGVHGMQSSWGGMAPPKDPMMVKPTERILRSGNFGPWDRPDVPGLDAPPPGLNPNGHRAWGLDSYLFFPNFMMVVWAPGWYLTYHYWPTAYNQHIFEGTLYFVPAKSATERLRQEMTAVTFKEFALQDCNTLEATQTMLETRVVRKFPLSDQELMLRALHKTANDYVTAYLDGQPAPRPQASATGADS